MILNNEQQQVINNNTQNIFLLAAAGSGKTTTIIKRINKLIKEGVNPQTILCITFTNKSANVLINKTNHQVVVNTFHGYCYSLFDNLNIGINMPFSEKQLLQFSLYKNKVRKTKPFSFNRYQRYLNTNQLIDFDDLILQALPIVKDHNFRHIFIDEFQDTNFLQFLLLQKMKKDNVIFWAVGDPDQSIYQFRGADVNIIKKYIQYFNAFEYKLLTNYRSDQKIIKMANQLISNNHDRIKKMIIPHSQQIGQIAIINQPLTTLKLFELIRSIYPKYSEIAVIYRFNQQGIAIRKLLDHSYYQDVKTLTFHEAKGLEFSVVILLGIHVMPVLITNQLQQIQEERRLLFVGITRAKHQLYIQFDHESRFTRELLKYQ